MKITALGGIFKQKRDEKNRSFGTILKGFPSTVEAGISKNCNLKCPYCPNFTIVKKLPDVVMPMSLYEKMLKDLKAMQNATTQNKIGRIINDLTNYTKIHFATEEQYMEKYNYPALSSQKLEHQRFIQKVGEFKQDFESGKIALSLNVANFVKDWLSSHILGSDKNYGPFLNSKGVS